MTRRRKAWLALCAIVVAYMAWAWFAGVAMLSDTKVEDMDWNADGRVDNDEKLQAAYAVTVRTTTQGARTCRSYHWLGRGEGEPIRVSCRTEVKPAGAEAPPKP